MTEPRALTDAETAELIEDWTSALRSGDYSQTQGTLQNGEGFCCLGVLASVAKKNGAADKIGMTVSVAASDSLWHDRMEVSLPGATGDSGVFIVNLPPAAWNDLGLASFLARDGLVDMNDSHPQRSFVEIADFIDSQTAAFRSDHTEGKDN